MVNRPKGTVGDKRGKAGLGWVCRLIRRLKQNPGSNMTCAVRALLFDAILLSNEGCRPPGGPGRGRRLETLRGSQGTMGPIGRYIARIKFGAFALIASSRSADA